MKKLMSAAVALALVCGLSADDKAKPADKPTDGKTTLDGTYVIVSGERDGKAIPKEHFDGSAIKITGTTIVGTDKDKKEFYATTYTLDTSKTPWQIGMTTTAVKKDATDKDAKKDAEKGKDLKEGEKQSTTGIIKVDGDTVTLAYALPGGKPPTEFKTGDKQQMFVMKRGEKKDK
jgi:uncharacterized protein (TIGR03067 family)